MTHLWYKFNGVWYYLEARSISGRDNAACIFEGQGYMVSFSVDCPTH